MPKRGRKKAPAVPVRGGWDVLPHNMGVVPSAEQNSVAIPNTPTVAETGATAENSETTSDPDSQVAPNEPSTPLSREVGQDVAAELLKEESLDRSAIPTDVKQPTTGRQLRSRNYKINYDIKSLGAIVEEDSTPSTSLDIAQNANAKLDEQQQQQGQPDIQLELSTDAPVESTAAVQVVTKKPSRKRKARKAKPRDADGEFEPDGKELSEPKKPRRKARKTKDNPYGLTPGETPFPEWEMPSQDQCEEVYRLLVEMHDDVQALAPEVIPAPSLEVTGCGEVPSVLDALIRTVLSGATTFANAAKMLVGLEKKFGTIEKGIGEGSINWNKVRLSSLEDVAEAIIVGGLGNIKAKHIKATLEMVHQENEERRAAYIAEKETGVQANIYGASEKTRGQKDLEILKTENDILSLDHIRGVSNEDAMREFTKYPGIGVKTSACVILFCLQQPCFAVDTHVDKFAKWLRWAPPKATENDVFSHLEVRCPDHLKYGLHQLFIRHGQTCVRCKRATVEGTDEWNATICHLEHLLDRFDKRQSKAQPKPPKKMKKSNDQEGAGGPKVEEDVKDDVKDEAELPTEEMVQPGQGNMEDNDQPDSADKVGEIGGMEEDVVKSPESEPHRPDAAQLDGPGSSTKPKLRYDLRSYFMSRA